MKLVYPDIETHLVFEDGSFPALIIENQNLFFNFIDDISRQINNESGNAVLSSDNTPIPISGNIDLLTDFFSFGINRKNLLTKIISDLEKQAVDEDFFETSQQLLGKVEKWVIDLAFCADIDVDLPKLSISSLLKSTGLCIKDDFVSLPEKLLTYIDLATRYKLCQIFIFVNLRSFLDYDTISQFTESCCLHGHKILLLDNCAYPRIYREQRTIIDTDLCEI